MMQDEEQQQQSMKLSFLKNISRQNIQMLIQVSKFSTFYLLEELGPAQYLLEDLMGKKYRTKISTNIQCTCHIGNMGHCPHSLYIMLRIFKIPQNNDILFKSQYQQADMMKILNKHKQNRQPSLPIRKITEQQTKNKQLKQWPKFEDGTVCSICYDNIENNLAIIDCETCHNYFHTKCLKVWVISKKNQENSNNSCPMCRKEFQEQIQLRIKQQQQYFVKYHQSHQINCSQCGKEILIKLYKCLLCPTIYLCDNCYRGWQHKSHDKFIGKLSKRSNWTVTSRSQFNMQRLNASIVYMKKFNNETDIKQMMGSKYQQFLNSYIKKPTMLQHVIESLLDIEKQVHKKFKKLQFHEQQIVCCMCKKKKIVGMRKMQCNHYIDEKCLKYLLKKGYRQCPIDKNYMLFGFNGIKLQIK